MVLVGVVAAERPGEAPDSVVVERMWRKRQWKEQEQATPGKGKGKSQTNQEYLGHCSSGVVMKWRVCDRASGTEQQDCCQRSLRGGPDCCALPGH